MKPLASLVAALTLLFSGNLLGAEASASLAEDAVALIGGKKTTWKSEVLDVRLKDGSQNQFVLVVEFSPFAVPTRDNPPNASAKLSLATPTQGEKGVVTVSSSLGDGSHRDVRLQEKDGVRTITFVRAIETIPNPKPKTQRILDKLWSSSFDYELRKDLLVLKGFSNEGTTWGVTEFIAPEREITLKRVTE